MERAGWRHSREVLLRSGAQVRLSRACADAPSRQGCGPAPCSARARRGAIRRTRGVRVAGELTADADPAAVRLCRGGDRGDQASAPAPAPRPATPPAPGFRARPPSCTATGRWCRSRRSPRAGRAAAACSAAAGTSIITPTSSCAVLPSASRAASSSRRAACSSVTVETIGNITDSGCSAATRRIARSWAENSSGCSSDSRMPRRPRNGLASGSHRQERQRLVGAGVERADDQRPAVEPLGDLGERLDLLVLARRRGAVVEEELRAQQPDALGALLDRQRARRRRCRCWRTPRSRRPSASTTGSAAAASASARSAASRLAALLEGWSGRRRRARS